MARILWDDVPVLQRGRYPNYGWNGCPYAVPLEAWAGNGVRKNLFRQCAQVVPDGASACTAHDPERVTARPTADQMATSRARRSLRWLRGSAPTLKALRPLSDREIMSMGQVGVVTAAKIREIRDTWDDERIAEWLEIAPSPTQIGPTEAFWAQSRDVFSLVGG